MNPKTKITLAPGQKFGRLTVIGEVGRASGAVLWLCKCACGNEVTVTGSNIKLGHTQSCGCQRRHSNMRAWNRKGIQGFSTEKALYEGGSIEDLEDLIR